MFRLKAYSAAVTISFSSFAYAASPKANSLYRAVFGGEIAFVDLGRR